ncbi:Heme-degrading monooxygenase HmoA [compost metagenome]
MDISILLSSKRKEYEEVLIISRWELEDDWKNWEKTDTHVQLHREGKNKERPAFIRQIYVKMYNEQTIKKGKNIDKMFINMESVE